MDKDIVINRMNEKLKEISKIAENVIKQSKNNEFTEEKIQNSQYDKDSLITLAHVYYEQEKYEKAFEICNRIISDVDKDQVNALEMLGNMYSKGQYVIQDIDKAIGYYERILKTFEDGRILFILGFLYGEKKTDTDYKIALYYFNKSAEKEYIESYIFIGDAFLYGYGVEKDAEIAAINYEKGANLGNLECAYMLGKLYIYGEDNGLNIKKDEDKGLKFIEEAANKGHKEATTILKEIYSKKTNELKQVHRELDSLRDSVESLKENSFSKSQDIFLRNIAIIDEIIMEYNKISDTNAIVEEKLKSIADFTVKNNEYNSDDIYKARKLYQLMILMNVPNTEQNKVFVKVVEQMRDVGKLKEAFNSNYSKLGNKIKEQYSDIIKLLQDNKDDELVKYINLIASNFPKKKQ